MRIRDIAKVEPLAFERYIWVTWKDGSHSRMIVPEDVDFHVVYDDIRKRVSNPGIIHGAFKIPYKTNDSDLVFETFKTFKECSQALGVKENYIRHLCTDNIFVYKNIEYRILEVMDEDTELDEAICKDLNQNIKSYYEVKMETGIPIRVLKLIMTRWRRNNNIFQFSNAVSVVVRDKDGNIRVFRTQIEADLALELKPHSIAAKFSRTRAKEIVIGEYTIWRIENNNDMEEDI